VVAQPAAVVKKRRGRGKKDRNTVGLSRIGRERERLEAIAGLGHLAGEALDMQDTGYPNRVEDVSAEGLTLGQKDVNDLVRGRRRQPRGSGGV
jgi:hypothetical protein